MALLVEKQNNSSNTYNFWRFEIFVRMSWEKWEDILTYQGDLSFPLCAQCPHTSGTTDSLPSILDTFFTIFKLHD